ncbi:hypothetical protein [Rubripirellula reticaptiva]|uniref:GspL periplasmic domain protein n=1 Tax=Rubripirellula reticaptiva TaxID=2528013 RepID=A0A5C6FDE9_9BACT|nr:hypothetical protein [Rubripirellula reticaptiva]TWU58096.1 GspL periplasmic domain protein [Rubripirellula reticaptiva]
MSRCEILIVEQSGQWTVACGDESVVIDAAASPTELADAAGVWIDGLKFKNVACVLSPASTSCFFVAMRPADNVDVRDRTAMAFELEDHLPMDAESFVADYVVTDGDEGKIVAAVAIESDRWKAIADAFEANGIVIHSIVPQSILATRSVVESESLVGRVRLLLGIDDALDSIAIHDGRVVSWKHLQLDGEAISRHGVMDFGDVNRVLMAGATPESAAMIRGSLDCQVEWIDESAMLHAQRGAASYLADRSGPWFELRREKLAPLDRLRGVQQSLRLLAFSAVAFLLAIAIGGWYRTSKIENEITSLQKQQRALFETGFPDTRVPGAILRRVRSEHAKVIGSSGAAAIDVPTPAPMVLRRLMAAFSPDVRFQFESIEINDGQVDMDLVVRSPVDAGKIASAIAAAGFQVNPPVTTQKDAKSFVSAIEATWLEEPSL